MYVSIRDLELRKVHFDLTFPPGEIEFDQKLWQASPMQVAGSVELLSDTLGEVRIRGRMTVRMECECDRCLERAALPVESDFDLYYRPADTGPTRPEVAIDEGESEIGFYEGGGIELGEVFREFVLLALPMQRTCSETCKGICPVCGQDRNQIACGCETKPADDRWAALRNLSGKLS